MRYTEEGNETQEYGGCSHNFDVVKRASNRWLRAFGHMTIEPGVNLLRCLIPRQRMRMSNRKYELEERPYPAVKSYRMGCPSGLELGPLVGEKRSTIGAVCSINYCVQSASRVK